MDTATIPKSTTEISAYTTPDGLRKVVPYWYPHTTMAKERWWGREILEVVSSEFRERSLEYYRHALESGVTTINGEPAKPGTIVRNGDLLENVTHRHEPPVTSAPVRVLHRDVEREFIVVDKPGSIPVHATGRYFKNTMVEILRDQGVHPVYTVNRLDRLTSGLLILPTTASAARTLTDQFIQGSVRKEYVARCMGEFPIEEVVCEQPLLTVDRQMGLNIVHPEGRHAKTIFKRILYDLVTNSSVVHCQPITGRSHQIRVHLQFLGYPIANDPVYCDPHIWGPNLGKGGVDLVPSDERSAPAAPTHLTGLVDNTESRASLSTNSSTEQGTATNLELDRKLLPRETGHDIGSASPVPLSAEAVGIISRLRDLKDKDEDWARWRDVAFRGQGALVPHGLIRKEPKEPKKGRRVRRGKGRVKNSQEAATTEGETAAPINHDAVLGQQETIAHKDPGMLPLGLDISASLREEHESLLDPLADSALSTFSKAPITCAPTIGASITTNESEEGPTYDQPDAHPNPDTSSQHLPAMSAEGDIVSLSGTVEAHALLEDHSMPTTSDASYCPECFLPLPPDPPPEKLYIFLHAIRYTTSLGMFETDMPLWAQKGYTWQTSG